MSILVLSSNPASSALLQTLRKRFQASELVVVSDFTGFQNALIENSIEIIFVDPASAVELDYPQIKACAGSGIPIFTPLEQQPVSETGDASALASDRFERRGANGEPPFINHVYQAVQALLGAATDPTMVLDLEGRIILANDPAITVIGRPREELIGQEIAKVSSPGSIQLRRNAIEQVKKTKSIVRIDDEGSFGSFDSIFWPILDQKGEVAQIAILARNVAERKEMETQLRERDLMLRTVVENTSILFAAIDREGSITFAEGKALHLTGLDPHQMTEKKYSDIAPVFSVLGEGFRRALEGKNYATHVSLPDQTMMQLRVTPIRDDEGAILGAVAVGMDITDVLQSKGQVRRVNQEREAVLNSIDDGIIVVNNAKKIVYANPACFKLTGLDTLEEFSELHHNPELVRMRDQNGKPIKWSQLAPELLSEDKSREVLFSLIPKNTNTRRWISLKSSLIYDEASGDVRYRVVTAHDVTELKTIQVELESIQEELERGIEQRTEALNQANRELQQHFNELQHAAAEAEAIASVASKINLQTDLPDILQTVIDETERVMNYPFCSILLYDEDIDALLLAGLSPPVRLPYPFPAIPRRSYEKMIAMFGTPIIISDTTMIGDVPGFELLQMVNVWSGASIPMIHNEELIGLLNIGSAERGRVPSPSELKLLKILTDQATIGIVKTRLFEQVSESRERLRALSTRLVEVQEQERRNLAIELHDEIGQSLTLLRLNLDLIARLLPGEPNVCVEVQSHLAKTSETTVRLLDKVREISLDLRPTMLDDLGLIPALASLNERFTSRTNIQILLKHSGLEQRYDPNLEITVFRIIQEALTNAARHADVDQVSVRVWADELFLRLQVQDQGVGFDVTAALQQQRSSGLSGMIERASACSGLLEIDSTPNEGTCITGEFPLYIYREVAS